jgi:hypothetical protein
VVYLDKDHQLWKDIERNRSNAEKLTEQAYANADNYGGWYERPSSTGTYRPRAGGSDDDSSEEDRSKALTIFDKPENKVSFLEAMRFCLANRGNLLNIETPGEHEAVKNLLKRANYGDGSKFWTGASDAWSPGQFISTSRVKPVAYAKWLPGRPNKAADNSDDCMEVLLKDGELYAHDIPCQERRLFICEI